MAASTQEYAFLNFNPPLKGKAKNPDHKGDIVLQDLSFGVRQSGKWQDNGSDGGRVTNFDNLSFSKECDEASPALYQACAMKTQFNEATFNIKSGKDSVLKVILEKVLITNAGMNYLAGQDNPEENYTLSYKTIRWEKGSEKTGFDLEKDDKK